MDTVSGIEFALEHDIFHSEELLKLMCYLSQGPAVYQGVESWKELDAARVCGSSNVDSAPRPSLLEAIAFTVVAGHVNDQRITHAQAGRWLCEAIESRVRWIVTDKQQSLGPKTKAREMSEAAARRSLGADNNNNGKSVTDEELRKANTPQAHKWRENYDIERREQNEIVRLIAEFDKLKHHYAHMPWPGETAEPVWSQEMPEPTMPHGRLSTIFSTVDYITKELRDDFRDWSNPVYKRKEMRHGAYLHRPASDECQRFEEACISMLAWRRLFVTRTGLVGIAPRWVQEGNHVMLVSESSVPFVFSRLVDDLAQRIEKVKAEIKKVDARTMPEEKAALEVQLRDTERQLERARGAKQESWKLLGDAFVDGIMLGEARDMVVMEQVCVI